MHSKESIENSVKIIKIRIGQEPKIPLLWVKYKWKKYIPVRGEVFSNANRELYFLAKA